MLTKRLHACAQLVSGRGIACDVGTDHAYLAAYLLQSGICENVIASDVAEGPLLAAKRTLRQAGLHDHAKVILSDGLKQVPSDGVTDVVIAGMGGETIVHILEDCPWQLTDVHLILQPMTKAPVLRAWLAEHGFHINREKIVCEGKFYYTVLSASWSGARCPMDEFERMVGMLDWTDADVRSYGRFRLNHYQKLSQQMAAAQPEEAALYGRLAEQIQKKLTEEEKV